MSIVISILLALIALIGAWVALQQMLIARTRLNHDLFDRRFAVYNATRKYIIKMLRDKGGSQEDGEEWYAVAITAPFLFDTEISDFLKDVSDRGSRIRGRVGDKFIYEVPEHVAEYNDHMMWLFAAQGKLEEKFQDSMNLFRLKPFSIQTIFPFFGMIAKFISCERKQMGPATRNN